MAVCPRDARRMLQLKEYRTFVRLDEPFARSPAARGDEHPPLIEWLVDFLRGDNGCRKSRGSGVSFPAQHFHLPYHR
jgi:hypothetical protein